MSIAHTSLEIVFHASLNFYGWSLLEGHGSTVPLSSVALRYDVRSATYASLASYCNPALTPSLSTFPYTDGGGMQQPSNNLLLKYLIKTALWEEPNALIKFWGVLYLFKLYSLFCNLFG